MSDDEIIAVVQAHKEGKEIECRIGFSQDNPWTDADPAWNFGRYDYRVKPEPLKPREFWLTVGKAWSNKEVYPVRQNWTPEGCEQIHVREVLE